MSDPDFSWHGANASLTMPVDQTAGPWLQPSIVLCLLAILLLASSLIANILITISILCFPKLRTNFNFYLLNIAVSDIIFSVSSLGNFCPLTYYGYYPFSSGACTAWLYSEFMFSAMTEWTMAMVALDRLVCISWPMFYRKYQSSKYSVIIIAMVWIWLHLLILPSILLDRATLPDDAASERCSIDYHAHPGWLITCVILVFWLPETVTITAYIRIALKMRSRKKFVDTPSSNSLDSDFRQGKNEEQPLRLEGIAKSQTNYAVDTLSTSMRQRRPNKDRKAFRLLSALVLSVIVFCLPADIYYFVAALDSKWATHVFYQLATFSTFIHCFLNPLLYHAYSEDMRNAVKSLFHRSS
ncbi:muscarinic acetylcholine receptor M4-like [Paramacrobiotus metropolitanus]|uniref:muscarinic acetylcholine receptor M4-like n=1 Tax=Paramacrobiotus metropolitanus TaxID=2943436 RepID=UPI002445F728|nr:muscarinic acetylcholine receptor M4-like [Paramacrobiotus metropolitanus]